MSEESIQNDLRIENRQRILQRTGVAFLIGAMALLILSQVYLFQTPKFTRLRPAFIVQDIFTATSLVLISLLIWKLTRKTPQAEKQ